MAGGSTSGSLTTVVLQPMSEKLARSNHTTWKAQLLATLRGARLEGFVTGNNKSPTSDIEDKEGCKINNPDCEDWLARDQQVLSYILASISKGILVRIATAKLAAEAWKVLEEQFTSQTRACTISTRMALATTRKGTMTVAEYLTKMQSLGNDMAGKSLDDEDLIQYILSELDEYYNSIVNSVLAHAQPITVSELTAQLLSFESHVNLRNGGSGSFVNFAR
jgi:hypothetical protein